MDYENHARSSELAWSNLKMAGNWGEFVKFVTILSSYKSGA